MKRWGLRASSMSAVARADAGQNTLNNHLPPQCFIHDVVLCFFYLTIKGVL
jgi:hypothetical protein